MVAGGAHLEDGDRHPSSASRRGGGGGGATTGSWVSGQSVSTSGSVGSPSSRSEHAMATPASDSTFLRLNHLDIHADDAATQDAAASVSSSLLLFILNKKKKRGQRAVGADKSGRGLRQFSIKVCEKVESKGTTTYNEHAYAARFPVAQNFSMLPSLDTLMLSCVLLWLSGKGISLSKLVGSLDDHSQEQLYLGTILADLYATVECFLELMHFLVADELVAEFADPSNSVSTPDQQQYDEKNIRRRVYDALNVLMALDIISKDKKEIQWKGLPRTSLSDIEELKVERLGLRNRIEKKAAYLQELEEQFVGLQNLIQRNEQLYSSGNAPSGGVSLPFILVQVPVFAPLFGRSIDLIDRIDQTRLDGGREDGGRKRLSICMLRRLQNATPTLNRKRETRPHATVEVEISEDMQLVHFDFNSTPFELHDDNYVLKAMKFCERPQSDDMAPNPPADGGEGSSMSSMYQPQILASPSTNTPVRHPTSPPLPGIIKARVKNEH
ncbi:hypothetical protein POTOM_023255 [Populus tomentosa]|uniref:Transcription factor-like protein DPB n=1 Tax=Populus tomentosa TaxID=118781 RepID=A0A8X8CZA5_POPTO|nr:hypothetical protein POTOM_023255 [Populus tomentosa]